MTFLTRTLQTGNKLMQRLGVSSLYRDGIAVLTPDGNSVTVLTLTTSESISIAGIIEPDLLQSSTLYKSWLYETHPPNPASRWQLSRDNGVTFIDLNFMRYEPKAGYWLLFLSQIR